MNREQKKRVAELSDISSEKPQEIVQKTLQLVNEITESDVSYYSLYSQGKDSRIYYTGVSAVGDREAVEHLCKANNRPMYQTVTLDPKRPSPLNSFLRNPPYDPEHPFYSAEVWRKILAPIETNDTYRLIVYRGHRNAGWISFLKRGKGQNYRNSICRLIPKLVQPITSALLAADHYRAVDESNSRGHIIASPSGEALHMSATLKGFLTPETRNRITHLVKAVDRNPLHCSEDIVGSNRVIVSRLDATANVCYLLYVDPLTPVALDPTALLTPKQRRVAELAAAGSKVSEIAESEGISRSTVKSHLSEIYRRLNITSRVELARELAGNA